MIGQELQRRLDAIGEADLDSHEVTLWGAAGLDGRATLIAWERADRVELVSDRSGLGHVIVLTDRDGDVELVVESAIVRISIEEKRGG